MKNREFYFVNANVTLTQEGKTKIETIKDICLLDFTKPYDFNFEVLSQIARTEFGREIKIDIDFRKLDDFIPDVFLNMNTDNDFTYPDTDGKYKERNVLNIFEYIALLKNRDNCEEVYKAYIDNNNMLTLMLDSMFFDDIDMLYFCLFIDNKDFVLNVLQANGKEYDKNIDNYDFDDMAKNMLETEYKNFDDIIFNINY